MEKSIENAIDNGLESISSGLYIFSIGLGIVLIILGVIFLFIKKDSKGKKSMVNGGLICLFIGIAAIVSGFMQIFF